MFALIGCAAGSETNPAVTMGDDGFDNRGGDGLLPGATDLLGLGTPQIDVGIGNRGTTMPGGLMPSPPAAPSADCIERLPARTDYSVGTGSLARFARYSPDGLSLAIQVAPEHGTPTLMELDVCTGVLTSLGAAASAQSGAVYSPDGSRLYYTFGTTTEDSSVRMLDLAAGTGPVDIADAFGAMMPDVSPDGSTLIYRQNGGNLFMLGLDGSSGLNELGFGGDAPRFSPSGKSIVYTQWADEEMHVYVRDLVAGTTRDLGAVDASETRFASADFLPDERVVVASDAGIEVIGSSGRRDRISAASGWLDVAPDGRTLVLTGAEMVTVIRL